MSLPDGAEYWWDVKGWNKTPRKLPKGHGVRLCPACGMRLGCIKHGKRHWKKVHPELPLPVEFPLANPIHP